MHSCIEVEDTWENKVEHKSLTRIILLKGLYLLCVIIVGLFSQYIYAACAQVCPSKYKDLKFEQIIAIAKNYSNMYASIGHHPCYINSINHLSQEEIEGIFKSNIQQYKAKIIAIGECGLDYYKSKGDENLQKKKQMGSKI